MGFSCCCRASAADYLFDGLIGIYAEAIPRDVKSSVFSKLGDSLSSLTHFLKFVGTMIFLQVIVFFLFN